MERVRNSRRIQVVFDVILGIASLALAMIFSASLDWPVNMILGIIIVSGTVLVISQHRRSNAIDNSTINQEN